MSVFRFSTWSTLVLACCLSLAVAQAEDAKPAPKADAPKADAAKPAPKADAPKADAHAAAEVKSVEPDAALDLLKKGNERYAGEKVSEGKPVEAKRLETAKGQHPYAIIVGCADSRTAPEILFEANLGDLFVVRTAGNLVDDHALGSIEYAVEHLGARLIVVLGHERCGAVTAAIGSATAPGHVGSLVKDIQPAVAAAKGKAGDNLANTVQENASEVAAKIRKEAQLGELKDKVKVVAAYYDLDSGKIEWLKD